MEELVDLVDLVDLDDLDDFELVACAGKTMGINAQSKSASETFLNGSKRRIIVLRFDLSASTTLKRSAYFVP